MQLSEEYDQLREALEIMSEKNRYKILITLFASQEPLSFSQLKAVLPSIKENTLHYHLEVLKKNGFVKNQKKKEYKRDEDRSFYLLTPKVIELFDKLELTKVKNEFQTLFNKLA